MTSPPPVAWQTPASGSEVVDTLTGAHQISYADGYWFSITRSGQDLNRVRYAIDPLGAWTEISLPAAPVGYTVRQYGSFTSGVVGGGGYWAFLINYYNSTNTINVPAKKRIIWTTDPGGQWFSYDLNPTDGYHIGALHYADGWFVCCGYSFASSPRKAMIGYCRTPNGAWSFRVGVTYTGYDETTTGAGSSIPGWNVTDIVYAEDIGQWATAAYGSIYQNGYWSVQYCQRYAPLPWGPWSACPETLNSGCDRLTRSGGHWLARVNYSGYVGVTKDLSLGWGTDLTDVQTQQTMIGDIKYGNGYWITSGVSGSSAVTYLSSPLGDIYGNYTRIYPSEWGSYNTPNGLDLAYDGTSTFVAGSDAYGRLKVLVMPITSTDRPLSNEILVGGNQEGYFWTLAAPKNNIGFFDEIEVGSNNKFLGQLTNDYFAYITATGSVEVRSANNYAVVSGTAAGSFVTTSIETSHNKSGDLYFVQEATPTTYNLYHVTETSGVPTVDTVGTATVTQSSNNYVWLDDSGTQLLVTHPSSPYEMSIINTANAATVSSFTPTGHAGGGAGIPALNRVLFVCDTHEAIELWNASTGTLLDSDTSVGYIGHNLGFVPIGNGKMFGAWTWNGSYSTPQSKGIGVVNCTGDTITWDWGPTPYATKWTGGTEVGVGVNDSGYGFFGPIDSTSSAPRVFWVNLSTGEVFPSTPEPSLQGVGGFSGYKDFVVTSTRVIAPWSSFSSWYSVWGLDQVSWSTWMSGFTTVLLRHGSDPDTVVDAKELPGRPFNSSRGCDFLSVVGISTGGPTPTQTLLTIKESGGSLIVTKIGSGYPSNNLTNGLSVTPDGKQVTWASRPSGTTIIPMVDLTTGSTVYTITATSNISQVISAPALNRSLVLYNIDGTTLNTRLYNSATGAQLASQQHYLSPIPGGNANGGWGFSDASMAAGQGRTFAADWVYNPTVEPTIQIGLIDATGDTLSWDLTPRGYAPIDWDFPVGDEWAVYATGACGGRLVTFGLGAASYSYPTEILPMSLYVLDADTFDVVYKSAPSTVMGSGLSTTYDGFNGMAIAGNYVIAYPLPYLVEPNDYYLIFPPMGIWDISGALSIPPQVVSFVGNDDA